MPEQAAAVALGTFRSMLRAPEVKMAWGTALVFVPPLLEFLWLRILAIA